jgi:hypothetical protein
MPITLTRHDIHKCIREVIDEWNRRAEIMHMGHKIELAAELADAVFDLVRNEQPPR